MEKLSLSQKNDSTLIVDTDEELRDINSIKSIVYRLYCVYGMKIIAKV